MRLEKRDGYTQEQMANKLNIARTTYTGYENGNFAPSLETALQIKQLLKYNKDDIFLTSNDSDTNRKVNWLNYIEMSGNKTKAKKRDKRIKKN